MFFFTCRWYAADQNLTDDFISFFSHEVFAQETFNTVIFSLIRQKILRYFFKLSFNA